MLRLKFNTAVLNDWIEKNRPLAREKLSAKTGFSVASLDSVRRGAHIPRHDALHRLAAGLGCDVKELVVWAPSKSSEERSA